MSADIPPIPPHIEWKQGKALMSAMLQGDPDLGGIVRQGTKQALLELPPRSLTGGHDAGRFPVPTTRRRRSSLPRRWKPTSPRTVAGEVRFSDGDRALYATDASNYRQVPIGVVVPRTVEDVVATVAACRRHGAPVLSRGGGTSLAGQCCNVAVVIDWSKYLNRVLEIDPEARTARVQPGCVLDDLRRPGR